MSDLFLVFDIESVGLHGAGFAVGWVVVDRTGHEREAGYAGCSMDSASAGARAEDVQWVAEHVEPFCHVTHDTPEAVRAEFWAVWLRWKKLGAVMAADCCWPVEARFLIACVDDDREGRNWEGPYPLHDVGTARLAAGLDPLGSEDRLESELPLHNPLGDARQSARLLLEALS